MCIIVLIRTGLRLFIDQLVRLAGCHYHFQQLARHVLSERTKSPTLDDIEILLETEHFLLVNKHFDVLINSDDPNQRVTLQHQVHHLYPNLANQALKYGFYFAHRLDFATSGVICVAKTKAACRAATEAFEKRRVTKLYVAVLRGHVSHDLISIEFSIGEDTRSEYASHHLRMCIGDKPYCQGAREARTTLLVLERGLSSGHPATKVLLQPHTGRRHQLRLHCSELGHTIVGDYTYSNRKDVFPQRMYLHSLRLVLPTSLENVDAATVDPFLPCDWWTPVQTHCKLDEAYLKILGEPQLRVPNIKHRSQSSHRKY